MNKNVLAATGGLNESKTLGRVEPLHSTFSHHVVSAGSKNNSELPVPANRLCPTGARYAVWSTLDSLNHNGISAENDQYRGAIAVFARFAIIWRGEDRKNTDDFNFIEPGVPDGTAPRMAGA
jgi:hypothetical protein